MAPPFPFVLLHGNSRRKHEFQGFVISQTTGLSFKRTPECIRALSQTMNHGARWRGSAVILALACFFAKLPHFLRKTRIFRSFSNCIFALSTHFDLICEAKRRETTTLVLCNFFFLWLFDPLLFQPSMPPKKRKRTASTTRRSTRSTPPPVTDQKSWKLGEIINGPRINDPPKTGPVINGRREDQQTQFKSILSVLLLFVTEDMIKHIVNETNNRPIASAIGAPIPNDTLDSAEKDDDESDAPGRTEPAGDLEKEDESDDEEYDEKKESATWTPLTVEEFKRWMAVWIVMGLCQQPAMRDHWRTDSNCNGIFGTSFIARTMPRDRFLAIRHRLRFDIHRLHKMFTQQTKSNWHLRKWINIDDQLVLFKGRYAHRQHVRGKPHATGLKYYVLCDDATFVWDTIFYYGQKLTVEDIVSHLLRDVSDHYNHIVVMDSWFSTFDLARSLHQTLDYYFLMVTAKNRPSFLFSDWLLKNIEKGETKWCYNKQLATTALAWSDRRTVCFMTNAAGTGEVDSKREGRKIPEIVELYNLHSHSVDQADAALNEHLFPHRNRKWTQCAIQTLLQIAINNSIIYWEALHGAKSDRSRMRAELANLLAPSTHLNVDIAPSERQQHFVVAVESSTQKCSWCRETTKKEVPTKFQCLTCINQRGHPVALHAKCFKEYHDAHQLG